uniref:Uncharacterized protein n=1 Tax=Triticum urartu TaxID=4572 RepID=A0A8R7UPL3_TRIUA
MLMPHKISGACTLCKLIFQRDYGTTHLNSETITTLYDNSDQNQPWFHLLPSNSKLLWAFSIVVRLYVLHQRVKCMAAHLNVVSYCVTLVIVSLQIFQCHCFHNRRIF